MTNENQHIGADPRPMILTPADFADTGQWRLVIHVAADGMGAVLRHVSDTSRPAVRLFDDHWEPLEGRSLLERIENSVYEHPGILDDYATEIVVTTPNTTWIPTEILSSGEFMEENVFNEFFPGENEVMTDRVGEATALFSLAPGFDGFMARTVPGARMRSHLAVLAERMLADAGDGIFTVNIILYRSAVTLVASRGETLLCASEHPVTCQEDVSCVAKKVLEAFGEDGEASLVNIFDFNGATRFAEDFNMELMDISHVRMRELPDTLTSTSLSPAVAITVFKEVTLMTGFFGSEL